MIIQTVYFKQKCNLTLDTFRYVCKQHHRRYVIVLRDTEFESSFIPIIIIIIIIIIGIQPLGRSGQRPEFSQATGMALVRCILGKFLGVACHCFPPLLDVPTFHHKVPPRPPLRERPQRRKWELWARMLSGNFAEMTTSTPFRDLLHAANLRHGTYGFTSPPRTFFALKNPTASAGFEPANLGTKGQHATPRPPKPIPIPIR